MFLFSAFKNASYQDWVFFRTAFVSKQTRWSTKGAFILQGMFAFGKHNEGY